MPTASKPDQRDERTETREGPEAGQQAYPTQQLPGKHPQDPTVTVLEQPAAVVTKDTIAEAALNRVGIATVNP